MMRIPLLFFCLVLGACATTPSRSPADFSQLYEGRPQTVFATELPADSHAAAIRRGDIAYRNSQIDRALYFYVQAIELDETSPEAFYRIGVIHRQRGKLDLAARSFGYALERDPNHIATLEELGMTMLANDEPEAAAGHFEKALRLDEASARANNGLGIVADLRGEHEAAAARFRDALTAEPESTTIMNNLGYSLYLDGDLETARATFEAVLKLDRKHELATRNLALVHVRQGRHLDALNLLERVTDPPAASNDVGYLCMLDRQYDCAERFLSRAISLSAAYYQLAHDNLEKNRQLSQLTDPQLARTLSPAAAGPVRADAADAAPPVQDDSTTASDPAGMAPVAKTDHPTSPEGRLYLKRYVRADVLNVRDDSSEVSSILDRIRRGRVVRVLEKSGDWAYVLYWHYQNGNVLPRNGWVHAAFLTEKDSSV